MPDIFLSYSREDQEVARRYAESFRDHPRFTAILAAVAACVAKEQDGKGETRSAAGAGN
jgi:hypothetical protein